MVDLLEKALASHRRELQQQLHKVNLLCLLARGMLLSQHCDDPTLQSILLSMIAPSFKQLGVPGEAAKFSKVMLLKLLRWFCHESSHLHAAVDRVCSQVGGALECEKGAWSGALESLMLVSLLRSLGLRSRLVMVLHPLPLKTPVPGKVGMKKGKAHGKKIELKDAGADEVRDREKKQGAVGFGEKLLRYNLQKGLLSDGSAEVGNGGLDAAKELGGCSRVPGDGGSVPDTENRSGSLRGKGGKRKGKSSDGRRRVSGKGNKRADSKVSTAGASPYFAEECEGAGSEVSRRAASTKARSGCSQMEAEVSCHSTVTSMPKVMERKGRRAKKSPSPEFTMEEQEDGEEDDDEFVVKRKRRRKLAKSATPSKKKKTLIKKEEQPPTKPSSAPQSSPSPSSAAPLSHSSIPSTSSSFLSTSSSPTPVPSSKLPSTPSASPAPSAVSSLSSHLPSSHIPSASSSLSSSSSTTAGTALSATLPPVEVEFEHAEETGNWAEVLSPDQQRWWCLHPLSRSIDQPQLCEKHCAIPLRYVVAFENSESCRHCG